jgi:LysR family glycine cleavage system transcriptional activator
MTTLPPLRLLVTFDTVARLRSMQLAAEALNVTPPAITQAVRALEEHVGVPLLDRGVKPARLNPAGERLAQATRAGLGTISDVIEEVRCLAGLSGPHITVSCTIGMATYWLMPRLSQFYERHETVTVNVQAPPSDLPSLSPGIDVALRYGHGGWDDGDSRKLFDEVVCPVGTAAAIDAVMRNPAGLSSAPLIHVRSAAAHHWAGWSEYLAARRLPRPSGPVHVFDNYIHAVQAALGGRGIMLGWRSITRDLVADGTLTELPGGAHDFGTAYFVTASRSSRSKAAVADFLRWLEGLADAA